MLRTRALGIRGKAISADASLDGMHFEEGAWAAKIVWMVGVSVSSNAVSGRSIFGEADTAATAISANKAAVRSRDDI
jgi:hypothetical protein